MTDQTTNTTETFETLPAQLSFARNQWGAIVIEGYGLRNDESPVVRKWRKLEKLIAKIEALGSFERVCDFDSKRRGVSVSVDVYGFCHIERRLTAVVQVRRSERRTRNGYLRQHKSYFLIGRNESGSAFSHCVPWNAVRSAVRSDPNDFALPVKAAMSWIFDVSLADVDKLIRQGDTALLPVNRAPMLSDFDWQGDVDLTLDDEGSHLLWAERLAVSPRGGVYALNPALMHRKRQHGAISVQGWAKICVGRREASWDFASSTAD